MVELTVEKLVYEGYGLARSNGRVFLIPLAAPGDRVKVKPVKEHKGVVIAHIEEILKPSDVRRSPPCSYYERCGGCQLQHINYSAQLQAKLSFVKESLERIAKVQWAHEIPIYYGAEFEYRLRTQLRQKSDGVKRHIGFYRAGSREICDITSCMVLSPALNAVVESFRSRLDGDWDCGSESIRLISGDDGSVSAYPKAGDIRSDNVEITCGENKYLVGPTDFFQANRYLLPHMLDVVVGRERGAWAVDLYCGVGFFSIALARRFDYVVAVESNLHSVQISRQNAFRNHLDNITFLAQPVEQWLPTSRKDLGKIDFVLVNPPRIGLSRQAIKGICNLRPNRLTYVSCNPTTLARDLKRFLAGNYEIASIEAIDLLPQTYHIETVVRLVDIAHGVG